MVRGPPCKFFLRFNKNLAGGFQTYSYCEKNSRGSKEESTSSDCSLGETWGPVTKDFKRDTQSNIYFFPWVFSRDPAQLMSNIILHQVFLQNCQLWCRNDTIFWHTVFCLKDTTQTQLQFVYHFCGILFVRWLVPRRLWSWFVCNKQFDIILKRFGGYGSYHPRSKNQRYRLPTSFRRQVLPIFASFCVKKKCVALKGLYKQKKGANWKIGKHVVDGRNPAFTSWGW